MDLDSFISSLRYMSSGIYYNKDDKRKKWEEQQLIAYLVKNGVKISDLEPAVEKIKENTRKEQETKRTLPDGLFSGADRDLQFVTDWLNQRKDSISDTGEIKRNGYSQSLATLNIAITEYNNRLFEMGLEKNELKMYALSTASYIINSALNKAIENHVQERNQTITKKVKYDPSANPKLVEEIFKDIITGSKDDYSAYIAGIRHWMWQVKRRMLYLNPESIYQLMLILFGPQNVGKSKLVQALVSPWEGLAEGGMDFKEALDPRNTSMHCTRAILTVDELTGMDKQALEAIKSFITQDTKVSRILGTNARESVVIRTSLIGSTNKHIIDLIYDPTGMRRFLEIPIERNTPLTKKEIENIKDNSLEMWRSVDENALSPLDYTVYPTMFERVKAIQQLQIRKDPIQIFISDKKLIGEAQDEIRFPIPISSLYPVFRNWLKKEGFMDMGKETFSRMLNYHSQVVENRVYLNKNVVDVLPQYELSPEKKDEEEIDL